VGWLRRCAHLLGFAAALLGCSKGDGDPPRDSRGVVSELAGPDDFVDLSLHLRAHERGAEGAQSLSAEMTHDGKVLAITIVLEPGWKKTAVGDIPVQQGVVTVRSLGAASDCFLQRLDAVYGTKMQPKVMRLETRFTAITLSGDPTALDRGPVQIKLFHESDDEDAYAELYVNVDLAKRVVEWAEKDMDYRRPVVRALIAKASESK
jgi:hypothetical protein